MKCRLCSGRVTEAYSSAERSRRLPPGSVSICASSARPGHAVSLTSAYIRCRIQNQTRRCQRQTFIGRVFKTTNLVSGGKLLLACEFWSKVLPNFTRKIDQAPLPRTGNGGELVKRLHLRTIRLFNSPRNKQQGCLSSCMTIHEKNRIGEGGDMSETMTMAPMSWASFNLGPSVILY